ncbi:hypothetical protein EDB85DRAFT_1893012 [Lactarius pseudohatsudake]|nr:hypothetical protein EDB85DRAFT_1893012 [Lactarius pseudohatsudake]
MHAANSLANGSRATRSEALPPVTTTAATTARGDEATATATAVTRQQRGNHIEGDDDAEGDGRGRAMSESGSSESPLPHGPEVTRGLPVVIPTQVEQDRTDQAELDRLAQEEADAQVTLRQKEADNQLREAEKKKPKLNDFDPDRVISDWIEPRPAPYAINKLNNLEYVELDYFTTKGCIEAGADTGGSANLDTLAFTQLDGTISEHQKRRGSQLGGNAAGEERDAPFHGEVHNVAPSARSVTRRVLCRPGVAPENHADKWQTCPPALPKPSQVRMVHSLKAQRGFQHRANRGRAPPHCCG